MKTELDKESTPKTNNDHGNGNGNGSSNGNGSGNGNGNGSGNGSSNGQQNLIDLKIIVNGKEANIQVNVNSPLHVAVEKALKETENLGRPIDHWRLKYGEQILDINKTAADYNLPDNAVLFLSLTAGQGG